MIAIAVSTGVGWLSERLAGFGWALPGVSALGCFGIIYWLFDRYGWRRAIARRFLLVPDLNGEWLCQGRTTVKHGEPVQFAWDATVTIRQSWSRMVVRLKTAQSESASIGASLYQLPGRGFRLIYHYDNTPRAEEHELHRHSGQCDLVFSEDCTVAEGQYFTGRDRLTVGTMRLARKE